LAQSGYAVPDGSEGAVSHVEVSVMSQEFALEHKIKKLFLIVSGLYGQPDPKTHK
jgi:hypothetical protein